MASIPQVTLQWTDNNYIELGYKVYRSKSSMDTNNMPTPIAVLPKNSEFYKDTDGLVEGDFYYYIVSSYIDDFEMYSPEQYVEAKVPLGPDSNIELIGGDMTYGFFGEVSASEFITGDKLADSIGLTAGTSQYSDEPWLKFVYNGELIYIPKKPHRSHISWENIYQAGAVYGTGDNGANPSGGNRLQDASVTIGGYDFKVTLLRGANDDPTPDAYGYDEPFTHNSEWNKLMYPIHSGVHTRSNNPSNGSVPYNQWASYSDEDLLVHRDFGNGSRNWTQETHGGSNSYRLYRGSIGVTYVYRYTSTSSNSGFGWRPALRSTL